MFPMTITVHDQAQLNAVMAAFATPTTTKGEAPTSATKKETAAPKPKPTPAPTADPAPTPPTAEAEAGAAPEPKDENSAPAPTYEEAAKTVTDLARIKGRDTAIAVLAKFKAAKLPDVKPDQFAAVIEACKEAAEA